MPKLPEGFGWDSRGESRGVVVHPTGVLLRSCKSVLWCLGVAQPLAKWRCKRVAEVAHAIVESGGALPPVEVLQDAWNDSKVATAKIEGSARHAKLDAAAQKPGVDAALDQFLSKKGWDPVAQEAFCCSVDHGVYAFVDLIVRSTKSGGLILVEHKPKLPSVDNVAQLAIQSLCTEINLNESGEPWKGAVLVYPKDDELDEIKIGMDVLQKMAIGILQMADLDNMLFRKRRGW